MKKLGKKMISSNMTVHEYATCGDEWCDSMCDAYCDSVCHFYCGCAADDLQELYNGGTNQADNTGQTNEQAYYYAFKA